jgi:hypothetical protein
MKSTNLMLRVFLLIALALLPLGCGGGGGGGGGGATLTAITVTPANSSVAPGTSQQFTATGTFSNGTTQDITSQVTWSSSSGAVQISSVGLATTSSAVTATISAQSGTITGSTQLTVSGASLVSIAVTPANPSVTAGATQQFTATGTFSDGTTRTLTSSQVTWSSSSPTVQVSSTGLATTTTAATATVSAQSGAITGSAQLTVTAPLAGANAMAITVNGSLCSPATSGGYFNKPCVSVTVCNPDGSVCQTVDDILLDTGSYGLRIFKQALPGLTLTQAASNTGGSLAECINFADGSTIWGPVQLASVRMASEPAITIPIHVIDASFATPTSCGVPDATPVIAGYAGILGVGPLPQDCGSGCANSAQNGVYFSCVGTTCTGASVLTANQVPNPVASLPAGGDRNGVLVQLPAAPLGGAPSINGTLFLGIGTQANNTPASPTVLATDQRGDFRTTFNGVTDTSFLDTGSNALFFASSTIPLCSDPNWYCPPTTLSLSATTISATGSPTKTVQFNLGNFDSLISTSNNVFSEIGGPSSFGFDWGLPFFLGRSVFIGISGRAATGLGTGPYVAF